MNHSPPPGTAAHPIMFWLLTGMALVVFAPCVLVPIWLETQEIRAYEQAAADATAELQSRYEKNAARIEALGTDPLVNQRIVRRELNFQPPGEQVVQLSPDELARLKVPPLEPRRSEATPPETTQVWVDALARWLPAWPYRELFAKSPNRTLLLAMSGGLLIAAFVLYGTPAATAGKNQLKKASSRQRA